MKKGLYVLFLVSIILSGCSSYLTLSDNVSKKKEPYEKILVVGRSKQQTVRRQFEEQVALLLESNGIEAMSSASAGIEIPMDHQPNESEVERIRQAMIGKGYDGVVVTNLVDSRQYQDVIPGNSYTTAYPVRYGRFGRYVSYYPVSYWEPDRLETGVLYVLESAFYRLQPESDMGLQWLGRFELKNPSDIAKTSNKYAEELVKELLKESISNSQN
jgi:hypothetical protein